MVLINEKKFACATCIKGHRVSGCTHSDRPLFEIKKKGRPTVQCQHCRDKRKTGAGSIHTKCDCGDTKPSSFLLPGSAVAASHSQSGHSSGEEYDSSFGTDKQDAADLYDTRKGFPGSTPTFPNGLRDAHHMVDASDTSAFLGDKVMQHAERSVAHLLNPCSCKSGGICKCCRPKRESISRASTPGDSKSIGTVNESLIEHFETEATILSTTPKPAGEKVSGIPSSSHPPILPKTWTQMMIPGNQYLSPENMHHPAHTSPHIHKTKLYSPYAVGPRQTTRKGNVSTSLAHAGWASSSFPQQPLPPPKIRPLADMSGLLGAVFRDDGTIATEIPRSALGLPGIRAFDQVAEDGGVKIEPMEIEASDPLSFPTDEDVVVAACTCGANCECPGCVIHGNPHGSIDGSRGHEGPCNEKCNSCFNCADHLSLPSGISSIAHLLSLAAAFVPDPARRGLPTGLNAHDTQIMPPAARANEEAARDLGFVQLRPLQECCSGRCQCQPGQCTCESECCGCCIRCTCDEDGDDQMQGDRSKVQDLAKAEKGCHTGSSSAGPSRSIQTLMKGPEGDHRSCPVSPTIGPSTDSYSGPSSSTLLTGNSSSALSRQPSPHSSGTTTPVKTQANLRRAASTSQGRRSHDAPSSATTARRATFAAHHPPPPGRSTPTGKLVSKAMALHTTPHHPHPRPILPKPSTHGGPAGAGGADSSAPSSKIASSANIVPRGSSQLHSDMPALGESKGAPRAATTQSASDALSSQSLPLPASPTLLTTSTVHNDGGGSVNVSDLKVDESFLAYLSSLTKADIPFPPDFAAASSEGSDVELPLPTPNLVDCQLDSNPVADPSFDIYAFLSQTLGLENSLEDNSAGVEPRDMRLLTGDMNPQPVNGFDSNEPADGGNVDENSALNVTNAFFGTDWTGDGSAANLDFLQQLRAQTPNTSQNQPVDMSRSHHAQNPVLETTGDRPDIIDLSKPLVANDIERIMRALQQHPFGHVAVPAVPTAIAQSTDTSATTRSQLFGRADLDHQPHLLLGHSRIEGPGQDINGKGHFAIPDTTLPSAIPGAAAHHYQPSGADLPDELRDFFGYASSGGDWDSKPTEAEHPAADFTFDPGLLQDANGETSYAQSHLSYDDSHDSLGRVGTDTPEGGMTWDQMRLWADQLTLDAGQDMARTHSDDV